GHSDAWTRHIGCLTNGDGPASVRRSVKRSDRLAAFIQFPFVSGPVPADKRVAVALDARLDVKARPLRHYAHDPRVCEWHRPMRSGAMQHHDAVANGRCGLNYDGCDLGLFVAGEVGLQPRSKIRIYLSRVEHVWRIGHRDQSQI